MPTAVDKQLEPASLKELLSLPVEQLGNVDIGRANLLCAEGLPGAEELDVEEHVGRLDAWAERVWRATEQFLPNFHAHAEQFGNSEPKWRLLAMAKLLHEECRVGYHQARIQDEPDWTDSQDLLIHGITGPRRTGTCPSLPVFVVAIGRRLGYPVFLSTSVAHCFSRWDALQHTNSAWQERFNIEFHGHVDFFADEHYYDWPVAWPQYSRERHRRGDATLPYLRSMSPAEELAHSLCQRAICLEAAGRFQEAINAYYRCCHYDKLWGGFLEFAKRTLRSRAVSIMQSMGLEPAMVRRWALSGKVQELVVQPAEAALAQVNQPVEVGAALGDAVSAALGATFDQWSTSTAVSPGVPVQQQQHFGTPPSNFSGIVQSILHKTCEGTPAEPSFDLLLPHPPERKVNPYGSLSDN